MLCKYEKAEGVGVPPEAFASAIIKVACILFIGVVILSSVVTGVNLSENSTMYGLMQGVQSTISSGYMLFSLVVLIIGSSAVMHFLGFI